MSKNRFEIDMTNGSIMDKLVSFALPLMLSSVFQLLFNAVDIIVVGRFSGSNALASVGATTALINIFTNMFIGMSLGANVMTARYYAAGDKKAVSDTVHTSITVAIAGGIIMTVIGILVARPTLVLMDTPANVIEGSVQYMCIYFLGIPFVLLYNYGASILRAVGDTKRPLIFLTVSGVLNAVLNVVLVVVFDLGVIGVASATVFAQIVSSALVIRCLVKTEGAYKLRFKKLGINPGYLGRIMQIGIPAGIQSTVISLSNVLLQSSVNSFGDTAMAGYTAANNIFGFMYVTINSVSQACMSFTSQNYGAGKKKRMDLVLRDCIILQCTVPLVLGTMIYIFGENLLGIYTTDYAAIEYGMQVLAYTTIPYFLCGIMDLFPGALRGMGHSSVPMVLSIIGTVGTRVIWIYGFFPMKRSIDFLFISYPVSWIATTLMQIVCFFFVRRSVHGKIDKAMERPSLKSC